MEGSWNMESLEAGRSFLKAQGWEAWTKEKTDQRAGVPVPPLQKAYPEDAQLIDLVAAEDLTVGQMPVIQAIKQRRSHRTYTDEPLTLEELSFLVWATQGISEVDSHGRQLVGTLRTVPSGGARHPFETYLLVRRVEGLAPGLYRYLPVEHKIYLVFHEDLTEKAHEATRRQFLRQSAVVFIWTVIPYRSEWRYSTLAAKIIAQDSGHLCQNLYLACEAIGAGTCAIGAYDQDKIDPILGVDGEEEFTIYVAPVGKVSKR
jgi:SagB-type dehydrogenase family enzyme